MAQVKSSPLDCFYKWSFIWTQSYWLFRTRSLTASRLQQQNWAAVTETIWLINPEIFTIWSFTEKVCWPLHCMLRLGNMGPQTLSPLPQRALRHCPPRKSLLCYALTKHLAVMRFLSDVTTFDITNQREMFLSLFLLCIRNRKVVVAVGE